jgi:cytosine/adenosine deaminase-related metal-dependent hydrolase
MRTLITNATLIDCVHPEAVQGASVLIEDGRIREVLPGGKIQVDDAEEIDLHGACLMPGLWDVHIHPDYFSLSEMPLADQVTLFGHRMMTALTDSGIVGLRCAGAHSHMDVAWKRAFDSKQ